MNRLRRFRAQLQAPRQLLLLFLALTLLPASALVWLGWRLMEQDRILEDRRIQERRERATDLIAIALQQAIAADEQHLTDPASWASLAAGDARVIVLGAQSIEIIPEIRLPYYPLRSALPEAPADVFRPGEDDEFRLQDRTAALAKFRALAQSPEPAIRIGAELRVARNLRQSSRAAEALEIYGRLASEGSVAFGGIPADLVARRARCALLAELNATDELRREAGQLQADLRTGRWRLDRAAYAHFESEVGRYLGPDAATQEESSDAAALARIVESLWAHHENGHMAGREMFRSVHGAGVLTWRSSGERTVALAAGPRYVERKWIDGLRALMKSQGVRVSLSAGPTVAEAFQTVRAPADTGLPWTLLVSTEDVHASIAQSEANRRLLLAGLVLLVGVVGAGSYFVARAAARELAVARLQSDFVAAVSHEFRTPLTSLSQVNEILSDGRVPEPQRVQAYYQNQARAIDRLKRLVESLLDFGRMEAGTRPYRMQKLDASEVVRSVAAEFAHETAATSHRIELQVGDAPAPIHADREALSLALWNLLDNAVKYSPQCHTVWLDLARRNGRVAISVRDEGLGIPYAEQKAIFGKFVRGAGAKANGIKGTGVGLAMVEHLVRAHGGDIRLESQPGKGSTFTLELPSAD
jgi:signal transduction histidine kinase